MGFFPWPTVNVGPVPDAASVGPSCTEVVRAVDDERLRLPESLACGRGDVWLQFGLYAEAYDWVYSCELFYSISIFAFQIKNPRLNESGYSQGGQVLVQEHLPRLLAVV